MPRRHGGHGEKWQRCLLKCSTPSKAHMRGSLLNSCLASRAPPWELAELQLLVCSGLLSVLFSELCVREVATSFGK